MHVVYLGIGPGHIASCLKFLQLLGYGYERDETSAVFLKRVTLEMRGKCKELGPAVRVNGFVCLQFATALYCSLRFLSKVEALFATKGLGCQARLPCRGLHRAELQIQGRTREAHDMVDRLQDQQLEKGSAGLLERSRRPHASPEPPPNSILPIRQLKDCVQTL